MLISKGLGGNRRTGYPLFLLFCVSLLLGCSRTVIGGYEDSPDGKYRLWVRTFGAYGHAFADRTSKTIRIRLVEVIGDKKNWEEKALFEKKYHFKCSDVVLNSSWDKQNNVTVIVYDWGGMPRSDAQKQGVASNYIATLAFAYDKATGKFVERK
jgi:hypothetical protein